ncbi:hypothetical protein [Streptomyces tsukubensis]|uniref:hypothetical protein n=1 Tax=Streptomyces tsukubensis TaxID=83656 RepID=UPI00344EC9F7
MPTMTEHPRSLAPRTFSTEHTTLERVLSSLRLERFAACGVYEDLEAVLGPYAQPEDAELVAVSLAQVLDHLLIRVRTPALAGRCPAAVVDRACATRVRCAAAGGEAGPGPVRLMALAVLDLLNLVGDDL